MASKKRNIYGNIIAAVLLIFLLIVIFYVFKTHILVFNSCYFKNSALAVNNSGPFCLPNNGVNIIINKSILSYYPNTTLLINDKNVSAAPFSFLGNKPYITVWNQPSSVAPDSYSFLTIPDTFKVHMEYNASVDTYFAVMTNQQYVNWVRSGGNINEDSTFIVEGKNISAWFNESTGCAGYVAVIESVNGNAVSIFPDEKILYAPANAPTGACEI
ncbi:MAG: hypothetical protein BJBARM5_0875 [Candidatus Parvarchaeum acidophilus ARMAN-5]|jgi:hypothetical protein|uniref:Uncharacterized protein n=1 Tax=Candidatus Parvarchaeum acidophilus ARMAN-5 TaxID=662762 RepID=D6GWJ8_PARA5|nr:MAG: hypothetical protein BJBARM5_0875 [Candidatus Parvarchaeum acidophilus ARMAN-5]